MPIGFQTLGTVRYNNVTFDGTAQCRVNIEYVQDEAERTVIYQKQTITIRAVLAGGTDTPMLVIRGLLCQQGQELVFINQGFGRDLVVNPTQPDLWPEFYKDVKWGPKPEILYWEPIGGSNACEIEFQVTTCISFCNNNPPILALNYDASYSINEKGMTTRQISGYYEIAQTRNANRSIPATADQYRGQIAPNLPFIGPATFSGSRPYSNWTWEGMAFQRSQEWHTSADKSREDFTIIDRQISSQHAWPDYAVSISGRHRGTARKPQRGGGGAAQRYSLSMQVELADGINPAMTFLVFSNVLNQRIAAANFDANGGAVLRTIIETMEIEEDLFGRTWSFHAEYRVLGRVNALQQFVQNSGFGQPLGTSWNTWRNSMATLFNQYGTAGLSTQPNNDAITDLCGTGSPTTSANESLQLPAQPVLQRIVPQNYKPDPGYSYPKFQNRVIPYADYKVSRQAILQAPIDDAYTLAPTSSESGTDMLANTNFKMPSDATTSDIIQEGGGRSYGVRVFGAAERYGYPPPRVAFTKFGTQSGVKCVGEIYNNYFVANVYGVPLYRSEWCVDYMLTNSPEGIHPPQNQSQGINFDGTTNPN